MWAWLHRECDRQMHRDHRRKWKATAARRQAGNEIVVRHARILGDSFLIRRSAHNLQRKPTWRNVPMHTHRLSLFRLFITRLIPVPYHTPAEKGQRITVRRTHVQELAIITPRASRAKSLAGWLTPSTDRAVRCSRNSWSPTKLAKSPEFYFAIQTICDRSDTTTPPGFSRVTANSTGPLILSFGLIGTITSFSLSTSTRHRRRGTCRPGPYQKSELILCQLGIIDR